MTKRKKIILVFGFVLTICSTLVLRDCLTIDKCLDNGGKWNEELSKCEFK